MIDIQNLSLEELDALCRPIALTTTRALLRGLPPEDAEECANDVMLQILSHRENYNPDRGSLETYVRVVARSAALSRRRQMPPPSLPLLEELYITQGPEEYIGDIVEKVIASLNQRERSLFTLRFLYGMDSGETARRLRMSRGAVDVAVLRLRGKLRRLLAAEGIQTESGKGGTRHGKT